MQKRTVEKKIPKILIVLLLQLVLVITCFSPLLATEGTEMENIGDKNKATSGTSRSEDVESNGRESKDPQPKADAGPNQYVKIGATVLLNATGSKGDLGIENYTWTFEYDGRPVTLFGVTTNFTFNIADSYKILLNVTDTSGKWDTAVVWVYIFSAHNNLSPTIYSTSPSDDPIIYVGYSVNFTVRAYDIDFILLKFNWYLDGYEVYQHEEKDVFMAKSVYTYKPSVEDVGNHTITVNISDGDSHKTHRWDVIVQMAGENETETNGGGSESELKNSPPNIEIVEPKSPCVISRNASQVFTVVVSDPDGDEMDILWYVEGTLMKREFADIPVFISKFTYVADNVTNEPLVVLMLVSDDKELYNECHWTLTVTLPKDEGIVNGTGNESAGEGGTQDGGGDGANGFPGTDGEGGEGDNNGSGRMEGEMGPQSQEGGGSNTTNILTAVVVLLIIIILWMGVKMKKRNADIASTQENGSGEGGRETKDEETKVISDKVTVPSDR